jgi:hypothetical protein
MLGLYRIIVMRTINKDANAGNAVPLEVKIGRFEPPLNAPRHAAWGTSKGNFGHTKDERTARRGSVGDTDSHVGVAAGYRLVNVKRYGSSYLKSARTFSLIFGVAT